MTKDAFELRFSCLELATEIAKTNTGKLDTDVILEIAAQLRDFVSDKGIKAVVKLPPKQDKITELFKKFHIQESKTLRIMAENYLKHVEEHNEKSGASIEDMINLTVNSYSSLMINHLVGVQSVSSFTDNIEIIDRAFGKISQVLAKYHMVELETPLTRVFNQIDIVKNSKLFAKEIDQLILKQLRELSVDVGGYTCNSSDNFIDVIRSSYTKMTKTLTHSPNWIVVSKYIYDILKNKYFDNFKEVTHYGHYYLGNLSFDDIYNISVFIDNNAKDDAPILIGYKGQHKLKNGEGHNIKDETDVGVIFSPYNLLHHSMKDHNKLYTTYGIYISPDASNYYGKINIIPTVKKEMDDAPLKKALAEFTPEPFITTSVRSSKEYPVTILFKNLWDAYPNYYNEEQLEYMFPLISKTYEDLVSKHLISIQPITKEKSFVTVDWNEKIPVTPQTTELNNSLEIHLSSVSSPEEVTNEIINYRIEASRAIDEMITDKIKHLPIETASRYFHSDISKKDARISEFLDNQIEAAIEKLKTQIDKYENRDVATTGFWILVSPIVFTNLLVHYTKSFTKEEEPTMTGHVGYLFDRYSVFIDRSATDFSDILIGHTEGGVIYAPKELLITLGGRVNHDTGVPTFNFMTCGDIVTNEYSKYWYMLIGVDQSIINV